MIPSKGLDAVPASFRKPVVSSRFAQGLINKGHAATYLAALGARATPRSLFVRLPHEPEDARMTGVTRSLDRRLLALNVNGSLYNCMLLDRKKIA
jgi:hypothetical protein